VPKSVVTGSGLGRLPQPVGPFNYGVIAEAGRTFYIAGQIGADRCGRLVGDDYGSQYRQALRNIQTIVEAGGGTLADVCSLVHYTTTPLTAADGAYQAMKAIRLEFFPGDFPVSTVVQVAGLLNPGALIEVEARAVLK
jgi:2-iminobutanoate/2-iminopropanoate deaminase